jgi:hypothetical protein
MATAVLTSEEATELLNAARPLTPEEESEIARWHESRLGYDRPLEERQAEAKRVFDAADEAGMVPVVRRPVRASRVPR